MGNKKSREYMKQREDLDAMIRAQTEERPITADVFARGIGVRSIQLVRMPSFVDGYSWDVRQRGNKWTLYRGVIPPDVRCVRGLARLDADSDTLASFFDDICNLNISLKPDLSSMGGCDGATFQLALFGDLFSEWRIQWWSDAPSQWKSLVAIADRMMAHFDGLEKMDTRP